MSLDFIKEVSLGGPNNPLNGTEAESKMKTHVSIYSEGETNVVYCSRLINSHMRQLTIKHDGTIGDVSKKINNISAIPNDMFEDLATIDS